MSSLFLITLHALIVQACTNGLAANLKGAAKETVDMDKLTDLLVDKLVGRMLSLGSPLETAPQATNTRGLLLSSQPFFGAPVTSSQPQFRGMATRVQAVKHKLWTYGVGSSPLQNLALSSIDATSRRDVSAQASRAEVVSGWSLVDDDTKRKLLKVLDQVKEKESVLAGISAPTGFFDPLGLATTVDAGKLLFYREVELKHGRVAMLASLGMLVGEQFHPLFGGNIDVPAYKAFQETPLQAFWPAVVAAIAIPEMFSVFQFQNPDQAGLWKMKEDHLPGDLGFDPLGLKPTDPKEFKEMQTKELNNGRLAMIAAAGMIAQEIATGQKLF